MKPLKDMSIEELIDVALEAGGEANYSEANWLKFCNASEALKELATRYHAEVEARTAAQEKIVAQQAALALDRAAYALFQIKRMVPEAVPSFASSEHEEACKTLNDDLSALRAHDAEQRAMALEEFHDHCRADVEVAISNVLSKLKVKTAEYREKAK